MSAEQLKRAIREGARRQQGTFDVPSYISIGDPYKDGTPPSRAGRWTKPHHSAASMLHPARPEEAGPPAPPFMTGAQLTRIDNTAVTARWRKQIEAEFKASLPKQHSGRAAPYAMHEPDAYTATSPRPLAAGEALVGGGAPHAPPLPAPQQPVVAPPPMLAYAQAPSGYVWPPPPPPMILIPAQLHAHAHHWHHHRASAPPAPATQYVPYPSLPSGTRDGWPPGPYGVPLVMVPFPSHPLHRDPPAQFSDRTA